MQQMKVLADVICIVFAVSVITACVTNNGSFLLINMAKEPIVRTLVTICGQTIELRNIQPQKSALSFYQVKSDSHYNVNIEFQSGRHLQKEGGYVTNGIDFRHKIIVTDTDIEIINTNNGIKIK